MTKEYDDYIDNLVAAARPFFGSIKNAPLDHEEKIKEFKKLIQTFKGDIFSFEPSARGFL